VALSLLYFLMGKENDAELVKEALHMALIQRQPGADLVHHSNRGSEYASASYQAILHQHNIPKNSAMYRFTKVGKSPFLV